MKEQSIIRMKIGKTHSGKEIWMCMEENRIDEWIMTQMDDFSDRDFVDAFCAFRFLSTLEIKRDFNLKNLSDAHADGIKAKSRKKIIELMLTLKLISEEGIVDHGLNYVIVKPSDF